MTTIATDGKTIAADTQQSGSFIDTLQAQKIWRVRNSLVGISGSIIYSRLFLEWLRSKKSKDEPILGKRFEALVISKKVMYWGKSLIPVEVGACMAIGSGRAFAMGAMLHGASPEEAVRVAMQLDVFTGGKVKCLTL